MNVRNVTTNQSTNLTESEEVIEKGFWSTLVWASKVGVRTVGHTLAAGDNVAKSLETWSTLLPQQADDNVRLYNTRRTLNIASKLAVIETDHEKLIAKLGTETSLITDEALSVSAFLGLAEEMKGNKSRKKSKK